MKLARWILTIFMLFALSNQCAAWGNIDVSGMWISEYNFGPMEETMTANIQQVDRNLLGSFSVIAKATGEEHGGVIFGTIDGDNVKAYYISSISSDDEIPIVELTYTDAKLVNEDTLKGMAYYQGSNQLEGIPGFEYEAKRI